jgi:hypothetical protein
LDRSQPWWSPMRQTSRKKLGWTFVRDKDDISFLAELWCISGMMICSSPFPTSFVHWCRAFIWIELRGWYHLRSFCLSWPGFYGKVSLFSGNVDSSPIYKIIRHVRQHKWDKFENMDWNFYKPQLYNSTAVFCDTRRLCLFPSISKTRTDVNLRTLFLFFNILYALKYLYFGRLSLKLLMPPWLFHTCCKI